jgi:hypothetical protein
MNNIHFNDYCFKFKDFKATDVGYIDGENLTFANWTRFINDGASPNVEFVVYNHQIYIFATRDIRVGEELIGAYGDDYWKLRDRKKVD